MKNDFELTDELLEKINRFTRKPLTAEQVYAFPVILCDNEVDRDNERFSIEALRKLAELFIGKMGIFDHDPKGKNQTARIFDTEIKTYTDRATSAGEPYTCLVAKAYMVRTASSEDFIKEIEGGIKKEASVSCSIKHRICSVCGADRNKTTCIHIKGTQYGDKVCSVILDEPTEAYEWSFVEVPLIKGGYYMLNTELLKEMSEQIEELQKKIKELEVENKDESEFKRANCGDDYYHIQLDGYYGLDIQAETEDDDELDEKCFEHNNYFHSEERAKEVVDKIKFLLKLERLHDILCPDYVPNWNDGDECKYSVEYRTRDRKFAWVTYYLCSKRQMTYFPTESIAQKAVDMLNNGEI